MEIAVLGHARFFSRLAHMIPSDLYNHTESMLGNKNVPEISTQMSKDISIDEVNNKYFKHKKQPLTADEKKVLRLERKKRKYEPDQNELDEEVVPSSNTQKMQDDAEEDENSANQIPVFNKDAPSTNLDDLRKRLQERIAQMRDQRQMKKPRIEDGRGNSKSNKKELASENSTVNKKTEVSGEKKSADAASRAEALQQELLASNSRAAISEDVNGIEFNPILQNEVDISEQIREATMKKEGGKVARLQRLLKEAEKKRERLTTLMSSGDEEMQAKARAEQWNDVLTVAAGGKALLVSTIGHNAAQATTRAEQRIKKALKKREKKKEKSAKEWNERLRTVDDEQKARLDKRDENIKQKKQRHLGKTSKEEPSGRKKIEGSAKNIDLTRGKPAAASAKAGFGHRAGFEGKKFSGGFLNK